MIGRCIALGQCYWKLGFTLRGIDNEHLEMFTSGLNSIGEVKGHIEHLGFSLNPLGNIGSSYFLKLPEFILNNVVHLYLRGVEVDVNCLNNLISAIPNFTNLKMFLFHDNNFKEGEQKYFIEAFCSSKFLQSVSFSRLSPNECETLLTNLHTLHTIELYQLSPPSVEAVIRCLSNTTTLSNLQIHQSEVKAEFVTYLPTTLPSSYLKSLEFINCAIDSVTVRIIADAVMNTPSLQKLNLSDNLIDDEGGHHLADMIHSLTGADSLPQNLNKVYLDHNPFTETTIIKLVRELSYCLSRSAIKVRLSLGWQNYVQVLPIDPKVKECLLFDRSNEYQ